MKKLFGVVVFLLYYLPAEAQSGTFHFTWAGDGNQWYGDAGYVVNDLGGGRYDLTYVSISGTHGPNGDGGGQWNLRAGNAEIVLGGTYSGSFLGTAQYLSAGDVVNLFMHNASYGFTTGVFATVTIAAQPYKVIVKIPANNGTQSVRYDIIQDGAVVQTLLKAPGDGATVQTVTVPNNHEVTLKSYVVGWIIRDGQVIESPSDVVEVKISPSPTHITPKPNPASPDDDFTLPSIDQPSAHTNADGTITAGGTSSANPWKTSTDTSGSGTGVNPTDALTNATFRQGVDKLNDTLSGDGNSTVKDPYPADGDPDHKIGDSTANSGKVIGLVGKLLPASPPEILIPGTVDTKCTIDIPFFGSHLDFSFDLANYQPGISVFRLICIAVLTVSFYFMVVDRIQKAFAG